jgi:hypothetical protein
MINKAHVLTALILLPLCQIHSYAQTNENTKVFGLLNTNSPEELHQLLICSVEQRRQSIDKLILVLKDNSPIEAKEYAVKILGNYRASEAVSNLVENIELNSPARF